MEDDRNPKRTLLGNMRGTRTRGRPRKRPEDEVAEVYGNKELEVEIGGGEDPI